MVLTGCSGGAQRFEAPSVDHDAAAQQAVELYDKDGNGALSEGELAACPAILGKLSFYDANGDKKVDKDEIATHLKKLLAGTGGTQLNAMVSYKGKPLSGAEVVLEPEPFLGDEVQSARGVTDSSGSAQLAIPPEFMPEHAQRLKAVHYGLFKVRITHPSVSLPPKYNSETELGYETEPGNPLVRFDLK